MKQLTLGHYIITTPIKEILEDIKQELNGDKLASIRVKGDHISVTCPAHNDGHEQNSSCGIYIGERADTYGKFNCFTCGAKGTFVHFVALCFGCKDSDAKKWLIDKYGIRQDEEVLELEAIPLYNNKTKKNYLDESVLDKMQSWHPYMDKRKLSKKVCEVFKVKYDPKSESLVFPVWDETGKLWMLTRRSVKNKQFIIDKDKEKPVYLMNYIREKNISEVTVVESQINALTAWGFGYPAVATFGCNVTDKQMEIFNKSGLKRILLCFDGDEAGRKGTKKFIDNIRKDIFVDVIVMPQGKDVNDLTEEEFNKLPIMSSQNWRKAYG